MTLTLYRGSGPGARRRARDWAEIQERMLVPLYETVYDRLEVGAGTRLLGLGCGSGLALLLAAARGAAVTGCDGDEARLALARARLGHGPALARRGGGARMPARIPARIPARAGARPAARAAGTAGATGAACVTGATLAADPGEVAGDFDVVTAFDPAEPAGALRPALDTVARRTRRGSAVVLAGWGPPERCSTSRVLGVAARLAEPRGPDVYAPRLSGRDDLEDLARDAGLRPDGSGRVSCPFAYPDLASAVRGLLSTGLFDDAVAATDQQQVHKEIAEALHPYRRPDGSVRMDNVFRYVIARP